MNNEEQAHLVGTLGRRIVGFYLYAMIVVLIMLIGAVWSSAISTVVPDGGSAEAANREHAQAMMWAVVLLGALGGSLHALGSFTDFVGNRKLVRSWLWWYTARAPIGAALALAVYFVIRGGLMAGGSETANLNPYGIGAMGFLSGLFSEKALLKLKSIFDTLFGVRDERKDGLRDSGPTITQPPKPDRIAIGSGDTEVILTGEGFQPSDRVMLGTRELPTQLVSPTEIRVTLAAADLKAATTLKLSLKRSGPRNEVGVLVG